ncbi:glycosyltransferase [Desulfofustis glycolicus]|uniref:Glycosyltransferase 2-like domain-containing protein n=1 Tax=Desulfofustis glycolicus DSM 9705 TaxID=1121409 RepID=A0A1M5VPG3_9BACT|nr:glycosyltransferase family 2 protein [Desulfofustis glycolicus]SHH77080.1 hypothetical protein SAMN02745124_01787 [Desulfofustis glycolicus DSM 9705]
MKEKFRQAHIIILNWNGTEDTIECLKSIKNNRYENYTIILVDNGSEENLLIELKEWCRANFKRINFYNKNQAEQGGTSENEELLKREKSSDRLVFIENNENLGFAAGNNVALRYILSRTKNSLALLLNNDTVVERDFLGHLVKFINSNYRYVACTPQIRLYAKKDKLWNCGGCIKWYGNRKYYYSNCHIDEIPQNGFNDITFVTGCALMFKPQETGLLTERFFFGEEDFEFSLRLKRKNKKIACVYDSVIYHKVGSSISTVSNNLNKKVLYYTMRLMDLRTYSNRLLYILYIIIYLSYTFMINIKTPKKHFKIWRKVLKYLKEYDSVDRKLFDSITMES